MHAGAPANNFPYDVAPYRCGAATREIGMESGKHVDRGTKNMNMRDLARTDRRDIGPYVIPFLRIFQAE